MLRSRHNQLRIARFLLGLYIAILTNGVVFRHAHRLADGTIITHAHPFKPSPSSQFPSHSHTQQELIWLDGISNVLFTNPDFLFWQPLVLILALLTAALGNLTFSFASPHIGFRHRGPPVVLA
ncbi:hypothetical protein BN8_05389 [Fibrisoma limi BUZ 3]|uniref:Uncharacterized protein n=1 Tax=Fibrisoma limi BUZ 3 TaxID=1185876 RepID=I2GQA1_9BACT|nr:hypothetical protein [Fibrisoma limi]CCH56079.1 hypothetical protein BN8_05389 [Fibrisoma limi BUZ 3]